MILTVNNEQAGVRLDAFCAEAASISRSQAARLIEDGCVTVGGRSEAKKYAVREGDEVEITLPECKEPEAVAENIPLDVVYEDDYIIVINKPKGMVVHPAPGNYSGTLVNALLYHCRDSLSGIGGVMRPGIVHRIDKDTSGLLVVAKNDEAHASLSDDLKVHAVEREYRALVTGGFGEDSGTVNYPIGRHPVDRKKMAVLLGDENAREAITHYEVLERFGNISYLALKLETGRTHQIRVHMSYTGHALLGDEVYQKTKTQFEKKHPSLFRGQALHAIRLTLTHPKTKERMTFECELPAEFKKALEILKNEQN
ncbi:MAG: RluA family pseudouridine synthase [Ruminococcaceae bacterium]|nr:RluA family pseudouridine synthase [Oscillospiraceae bacterium]